MRNAKRFMYAAAGGSLALMIIFFILVNVTGQNAFMTAGITFMTICYHLTVRLLIGGACEAVMHDSVGAYCRWFKPSAFEARLWKILRVKRWKKFFPTFDESKFSLKDHSIDEIIGATCQAEIVHELDVFASLIAVLFAIPFGDLWVFLITSVLGAAFDMIFVIIQRYNRPRLMKLAAKDSKASRC